MKTATVLLENISPYSQSKRITIEKNEKEGEADFEKRAWRERLHTGDDGNVFIPPMAFKLSIEKAAQFLSMKIPGQGSSKYTKHFSAGVLVMDPLILPIKKQDVPGEWFFVPSQGQKGGGKRVDKCFPVIQQWQGQVTYYILDETITESVFKIHLQEAGNFIGIGRFRPEKGGFYGRYKIAEFNWS